MRDIPNWLVPAAVALGALYLYRRATGVIPGAQKALATTGEKISASLFDFMNPALRPENYNKPTLVAAQMVNGKYSCPPGYRYKLSGQGAHICLRED